MEAQAIQAPDYCVRDNTPRRADRPDRSRRNIGFLGMTTKLAYPPVF
jgi:hypothetical protein